MRALILYVALLIFGTGCGDDPGTEPVETCEEALAALETDIRSDLDGFQTDTDFTLLVASETGGTLSHSAGTSSETAMYRSASTPKLVTAAVILSVVQAGELSLRDHPQDHIPTWPTTGNLSTIELHHLLSFTSGLTAEAVCLHLPGFDFEACVGNIASNNSNSGVPGEEFHYGSSHLQVAGQMAIEASAQGSWQGVFARFKTQTGLFTDSEFDLPSPTNPRLAGGMHWNAAEYLDFLAALYNEEILTADLIDLMTADQTRDADIGDSPAVDSLGEDWHYGYGLWIECHALPFDCPEVLRVSSPGAYGAYPFIDYEHGYYGILAREGTLGSFDKGYDLFESVSPKLEKWAAMECFP